MNECKGMMLAQKSISIHAHCKLWISHSGSSWEFRLIAYSKAQQTTAWELYLAIVYYYK